MAEREADAIILQCNKFLDKVASTHKSVFLDSSSTDDNLFHGFLANSEDHAQLSLVMKQLLLLSHGQVSVEPGFSVNRQVDDDSLEADTFCCRRIICDAVATLTVVCMP